MDKRYGDWEVLEVESRNKVKVKCVCGEIGYRRASHLESSRTTSCKSCSAKKTAKRYPPPIRLENVGLLGKTYYSTLKYGAERRGIKWDVSQEYLWSIFTGKCALTGRIINLSLEIEGCGPKYSSFNASLDRIDSDVGYIEGNVQWVHKNINRLKNNYSQEDFISMCIEVASYANQQPSSRNGEEVLEKVQRLGGEDSKPINHPRASSTFSKREDIV